MTLSKIAYKNSHSISVIIVYYFFDNQLQELSGYKINKTNQMLFLLISYPKLKITSPSQNSKDLDRVILFWTRNAIQKTFQHP
jgi:hypothetical protein